MVDTSNLKTEAEQNEKVLKYGEKENIIFPLDSDKHGDWRIKKWHFQKGKSIETGEIICSIENDKHSIEFESFMKGKLNYFKQEGQKIEKGTIIAEIIGERI